MPTPAIDFQAILLNLTEANVRFVVIGGVAMHLHGADNLNRRYGYFVRPRP